MDTNGFYVKYTHSYFDATGISYELYHAQYLVKKLNQRTPLENKKLSGLTMENGDQLNEADKQHRTGPSESAQRIQSEGLSLPGKQTKHWLWSRHSQYRVTS